MKLILRRERNQPTHDCTLGLLFFWNESFCTIERPWIASPDYLGGLSGKSCVPLGSYHLERHNSEAHPKTWALVNPALGIVHWDDKKRPELRSLVLIHIANWARELRGCIGIGNRAGLGEQGYQVFDSAKAMLRLQAMLPWTDDHTISIEEQTP